MNKIDLAQAFAVAIKADAESANMIKALIAEVEALRRQISKPQTAYEAGTVKFEGWPDEMRVRYNACTEPCDMWTGPCACGAWHINGK